MKEIAIAQIHVGKRFRKDLGDIEDLKKSIEDVGLLHPIVVDDHANLVAGYRRIMAAKKLGWRKIECNIISIDDIRTAEIEENTNRKDFTASEIAAISEYVESHKHAGRPKQNGANLSPLPQGKTADVVSGITGVSPAQIKKIKKIKEKADKNPKKYGNILERVDERKLSVDTAHKLVTREERNLPKVPIPKGEWSVILEDMPIAFDDKGGRGAAEHHYPTMSVEELCKFKLPAAKNALIFSWIPASLLKEGIQILEARGFVYKTCFVWVKDRIGRGSWHRNQHELLMVGIKGKMPTPAKLFSSVIKARRLIHSKKPRIHWMIQDMYPKRKYYEEFSRDPPYNKNWTVHGNQIKKQDDRHERCKCNHFKILHNGKNNEGHCPYDMVTCGCKKFTPRRRLIKT